MQNAAVLLVFMLWVNVLPPLANVLWGNRLALPLDAGKAWRDGRSLLGEHKTLRGVLISVVGGTAASPLLGVTWWVAGTAALVAMGGDLLSSFIKRRLDYPSGEPVPVLDQVFEGLFPAAFLAPHLGLAWWQALTVTALFIPLTYWASRFWSYVLYRPPMTNYPRIVRSSVRLKEWRACHEPLARWQGWLNFEDYVYYRVVMTWLFKRMGLYAQGVQNALNPRLREETIAFPDLPEPFDGFRLLLLTDLHLDGLEELTEVVIRRVRDLEVDICLIGGDIRMEMYGPMTPAVRRLRQLISHVRAREGIIGVLGNHDCIEMVPELEAAGLLMLINDAFRVKREGASLWIAGVDDPHYYRCHDLPMALRRVPPDAFRVFLAHSPEAYAEAARLGVALYLCGHTHGGQICLPRIGPIFTHSSAPRRMAAGRWEYKGMVGYTSRGVGASGVPLRFNCQGEISLLTLRRGA